MEKFRFRREIGRNWKLYRVVDKFVVVNVVVVVIIVVVSVETKGSFKRRFDRFVDENE